MAFSDWMTKEEIEVHGRDNYKARKDTLAVTREVAIARAAAAPIKAARDVASASAPAPARVVVTDDTEHIYLRIYVGRAVAAEHVLAPNECVRLAHTLLGCTLWRMKE